MIYNQFLFFNFLYYLGLTYTSISRCTLKHFKCGLSILKVRKEKLRKYIIISIIKGIIRNFLKEKKMNLYIYFRWFLRSKGRTRVNYIKDIFSRLLLTCKYIPSKKIKLLLNSFSKTRNPKKITETIKSFFYTNFIIKESCIKKRKKYEDYQDGFMNESDSSLQADGHLNDILSISDCISSYNNLK